MPVAVVTDYPDATTADYEALARALHLAPDSAAPAGLLFHWGVEAHGGVRTVDVWSERASFDAYAAATLRPAAAAAGLSSEPTISFIEVANYASA